MVTRRTVDPSTGLSIDDDAVVGDLSVVEDLHDRAGFDPGFLGVDVPLPRLLDPAVATVALDYTHFTVLLRPDRRLAAVTGVGIDGAALLDLDRTGIEWRLDPRVPAEQQTGEAVYAHNDIDRGHLVRRRDPLWGARREAALANTDTFHYPNAAPQAGAFNQDRVLWAGLEDYLLDNAAGGRRLVVLTGPVLGADDPLYRGVALPLRFFKVAAFLDAGALAAIGYVLDQSPQLEDLPGVPSAPRPLVLPDAAGGPPPLGAYRTYQVPIADVAVMTGLDLDRLVAVDRFPAERGDEDAPQVAATIAAGAAPGAWRRLRSLDAIAWRSER